MTPASKKATTSGKHPPLTREQADRIVKLHDAGKGYRAISEQLGGLPVYRVWKVLAIAGRTKNKPEAVERARRGEGATEAQFTRAKAPRVKTPPGSRPKGRRPPASWPRTPTRPGLQTGLVHPPELLGRSPGDDRVGRPLPGDVEDLTPTL
jgi:hypothetical protein